MTSKILARLAIVIAILSTLIACGGSSSSPAPSAQISVSMQGGIPKSVGAGAAIQMSATVTNDSTAAGVDWTVTCGSGDCGSFSAIHTASGAATTYTSPANAPAGGTATIKAASAKDNAKTASTTLTISASTISVAFQSAPPASLLTNGTTSLKANVVNDGASAGVDWTVTCGSGACGSFSSTHTGSGSATTYTAPAAVPTGGAVTITAASTTNSAKFATASITVATPITSYNQMLNGSYVFQISGYVQTLSAYQVAGVMTADGNGHITGGEQVYVDGNITASGSILSGTYAFGSDGRGTITLHTNSTSVGVAGAETLGAVIVSPSQALLSEFDFSSTARGSMDLQTAIHPLNGAYAFVMGGYPRTTLGGVFNVDNNPATGNISGAGGVADLNDSGLISQGIPVGTVSAPDAFGKVTISIGFDNVTMKGFIVDDSHIKIVASAHSEAVGGVAIAQGTSAGTYSNGDFLGSLVYGLFGQCTKGDFGTAIAGKMTANGAGHLTGLIDANFGAVNLISDTITADYDVEDTGRVSVETSLHDVVPGPNFIVYLTQPSLSPLIMEVDPTSAATGFASLQAAAPYSFSGPYGLDFTTLSGTEADGTAQINANGLGTFTGNADVNNNLSSAPVANLPYSGTFTTNSNGRFNGTVTLNNGLPYNAAFYFIDSTRGFLIETDSQNVSFGEFHSQRQLDPHVKTAIDK